MLTMQAQPTAPSASIRCYGEQGAHGEPLCDGPDVRHVRVQVVDGSRFDTAWCSDCRADATADDVMMIIDERPMSEYFARLMRAIGVLGDPHVDRALASHREAQAFDAEHEVSEPDASAQAYVAELRANGQAYHDRVIDHDAFHARQRELWNEIAAKGAAFRDTVSDMLRNQGRRS
jgi:hypothetical protein